MSEAKEPIVMRAPVMLSALQQILTLSLLGTAACATHSAAVERPAVAPSTTQATRSELPVRRIRIYESGVAEFERAGQPAGDTTLLALPTSDIDDVLRTLVIRRGSSVVPVYSANFNTVTLAKVERLRANLPTESKPGAEYSEIVQSLKGERVELVAQGHRVRGRLIEFWPLQAAPHKDDKSENPPDTKANTQKSNVVKGAGESTPFEWHEFELTLLTDSGSVERYRTDKLQSLRPLDAIVADRLDRAVAAGSGRASELSRVLRITSAGGEPIRLSYVTDLPVPRITYRLHTVGGKPPRLEGLTLVHNDSDESWESVAIEISNAELDSSVVPFVTPRYWERPVHATREGGASVVPQLKKSSADALSESASNAKPPAERGASSSRRTRKYTTLNGPKVPSNATRSPNETHPEYAYAVPTPSTILAHNSALLPFLETEIKAEPGVWFGSASRVARSVVRVQNTTAQPLPSGMLSVFEGDRFMGETELEHLEPGRYGYFDYAYEPKLSLKEKGDQEPKVDYRAVTWSNDGLRTHYFEHIERTVEFTNTSNQTLTAFVSIITVEGARVTGVDGIDTDYSGRPMIAVFKVPANTRIERTVITEQEQDNFVSAEGMEADTLTPLLKQASLPAAIRNVLQEGLRVVTGAKAMSERKEQLDAQASQLEESIGRLPVSDTSHPVASPIAARFLQLEAQRTELQKQSAMLEKSIAQQWTKLKTVLSKLPQSQ